MMKNLCNTVADKKLFGLNLCAVATVVGGLHLALTESQPVLGMIDVPAFGWFSVQHTLGLVLVGCGACCIVSCM